MDAQRYTLTKTHQNVHLKWVNFMGHKYLKKVFLKSKNKEKIDLTQISYLMWCRWVK